MLIHTLTQYLESHKRLVVPQLGTFIVKEPGRSVVFSELLKRDDGVLRGLLRAEGLGELEAAGEIDRFVFEIRHAVEHGAEYRLEGFGVMKPGPNATIAFVYEPRSGAEPVADEEPAGGKRPSLQPEKVAEAVKTAFAEPRVSPSVKMNPDPSVRGLRYGKPPKSTDAYRYVDRAPRRRADRFICGVSHSGHCFRPLERCQREAGRCGIYRTAAGGFGNSGRSAPTRTTRTTRIND